MKRIKIQALILSLALAATVISACSSKKTDETIKVRSHETEEETTPETEDTTEATTIEEITVETTEETTTEETTTEETTVETAPPIEDDSFGTVRYNAYMALAEEHYNANAACLFVFKEDREQEVNTYDLVIYENGSFTRYFFNDENEMEEKETGSYDLETLNKYDNPLTYPELCELPCMIPNMNFNGFEGYADSIENGTYFAVFYAVTIDGTKFAAAYGRPIEFTEEEFLNLQVGDKLGSGGFLEVEYVDEGKTEADRVWPNSQNYYFVKGGPFASSEDNFVLVADNDIPCLTDNAWKILEVAPECTITDKTIVVDDTGLDEFLENQKGYPLVMQTKFWFYLTTGDFRFESSNGWQPAAARLYPFVIENGQIVEMTIEWR